MTFELLPIRQDGTIDGIDPTAYPALEAVLPMILENYQRAGFEEPWIAYAASIDQLIVGTCAFKTPPHGARVEIAYYTFPQYENHGFATRMAQCLVQIAKDTDDSIQVIARTLPIDGASAHILKKIGFEKTGEVLHPDDGLVWEWEYRAV